MSEQQTPHPFVADLRWAASVVRRAVESALAGSAPLSTCRECSRLFYFLAPQGLVEAAAELCPRCEPEEHRTSGLALDRFAVDEAVADRRGLLAMARWIASDRRCAPEDAVLFMERIEANEEPFRKALGLARQCAVDPEAIWRAAYLAWSTSLASAATVDPVAARMARLAATQRPDAVVRCVVKALGKVLYDGPVDHEGKCDAAIRAGEEKHGRKLLVTLHLANGTKQHRRGERDTAPEHRPNPQALGGVRAMMAEARAKAGFRVDDIAVAGGPSRDAPPTSPLTLADIRAIMRELPQPQPRCDGLHDAAVPMSDGGTVWYVCRRCGATLAIGVHPTNAGALA